jgi:hypothetical protein
MLKRSWWPRIRPLKKVRKISSLKLVKQHFLKRMMARNTKSGYNLLFRGRAKLQAVWRPKRRGTDRIELWNHRFPRQLRTRFKNWMNRKLTISKDIEVLQMEFPSKISLFWQVRRVALWKPDKASRGHGLFRGRKLL